MRPRCGHCNSLRLGPTTIVGDVAWRRCRACGFENSYVLDTPSAIASYGSKVATWKEEEVRQ